MNRPRRSHIWLRRRYHNHGASRTVKGFDFAKPPRLSPKRLEPMRNTKGWAMTIRFIKACLFDMDGTLLDSHKVFDRVWGQWAERNGVNYANAVAAMRGGRAMDIIKRFAPNCGDLEREARAIEQLEITDLMDVMPIPGARQFLEKLPGGRWTIVTSAVRRLACARLGAAGLPIPDTLVTAEDVSDGKPSPAGYLLAAKRLGCEPQDCVVFEDATAGIEAASAAGTQLIVVSPECARSPSSIPSNAYLTIRSFDELSVNATADGLLLLW